MLTHRQARKKLGSRVSRRVGTKTKVIPGGSTKRPPKYRHPRRKAPRLAVKVRRLVEASRVQAQ